MDEIQPQILGDDEFYKAGQEIHESPRDFIPVPKVKKKKKIVKQDGKDKSKNSKS